jgi:hypothetical protein
MLYNENTANSRRDISRDNEDQDSVNSAESDDNGIRTPVGYLNPLEEYLNSSPLDHGPPELSTLSERYGDPSSPSQRTPGAKARQMVNYLPQHLISCNYLLTVSIYDSLLLHHHCKNTKRQDLCELES